MSDVQAFINELEALESQRIQQFFDEDYDGACPCFEGRKLLDEKTLFMWGRCWRVSDNDQDLYIGGTLDYADLESIAHIVKEKLDEQEWYHPYTIIYDDGPFA